MRIFINILLIMIGIVFIIRGYRLRKYKDLSKCTNKWVPMEKIKDKDGYIKFHSKWSYLFAMIMLLMGVAFIIDKYIMQIDIVVTILSLVYLIGMFTFIYQSSGSISKFQK